MHQDLVRENQHAGDEEHLADDLEETWANESPRESGWRSFLQLVQPGLVCDDKASREGRFDHFEPIQYRIREAVQDWCGEHRQNRKSNGEWIERRRQDRR